MSLLILLRGQTGTLVQGATGITSAEAFGTARIVQDKFVRPQGISSSEEFGTVRLGGSGTTQVVHPSGISSELAFGQVVIPGEAGEVLIGEGANLEIRDEVVWMLRIRDAAVTDISVEGPSRGRALYDVNVSMT